MNSPPPPPFAYSSYGGVNNGNVGTGAANSFQHKLFDNSFTGSNIYSRSPPQNSSSASVENTHNTPNKRDIDGLSRQESPVSATKCIEKSLQSLDELINQRRAELMELRSSNNKRFSQARPPIASIDSFKSLSPEERFQRRISILQGSTGSVAGRVSPATMSSHATSDSPSYVSIPVALFEEMSQSGQKFKLESMRISELQENVNSLTAQLELSNQRNKTLATKLEELEELRDGLEEDLLSEKDELLFLRSQLQQKSIQISELERIVSLTQSGDAVKQATLPSNNKHGRADEAEIAQMRQELDDAIDENNKWYSKVQEIEQQRAQLEEEKKYADSLVFDWEASYAQLEQEYMKIYDHMQKEESQVVAADDDAAEKMGKLARAWKLAYTYQRKRALLRSVFDSMKLHMLQKSFVESKTTAAAAIPTAAAISATAADPAMDNYNNTAHASSVRHSPARAGNAPKARRSHTTSFLLLLALFQVLVWALIIGVGYFYVEELSPTFAAAMYHSLMRDYPQLRAPVESIANLFHSEF